MISLSLFLFLSQCVYVCVYSCVCDFRCEYALAHVRTSKDNAKYQSLPSTLFKIGLLFATAYASLPGL